MLLFKIQVINILNSQAHPITSQNQKSGIPNISQDAIFQDRMTIGQVLVVVFLILDLYCECLYVISNHQGSFFIICRQCHDRVAEKLLLYLFKETKVLNVNSTTENCIFSCSLNYKLLSLQCSRVTRNARILHNFAGTRSFVGLQIFE